MKKMTSYKVLLGSALAGLMLMSVDGLERDKKEWAEMQQLINAPVAAENAVQLRYADNVINAGREGGIVLGLRLKKDDGEVLYIHNAGQADQNDLWHQVKGAGAAQYDVDAGERGKILNLFKRASKEYIDVILAWNNLDVDRKVVVEEKTDEGVKKYHVWKHGNALRWIPLANSTENNYTEGGVVFSVVNPGNEKRDIFNYKTLFMLRAARVKLNGEENFMGTDDEDLLQEAAVEAVQPKPTPKPEQKLTDEQVKKLTVEQIKALTPDQIKVLTVEQIKALTPDQIKVLTPEQVKATTRAQRDALTKESQEALTREQLVALAQQSPAPANPTPPQTDQKLTEEQFAAASAIVPGITNDTTVASALKIAESYGLNSAKHIKMKKALGVK